MITRQEIWEAVHRALTHLLPSCVVVMEPCEDDRNLIGVGVFGVRPDFVLAVEDRIAALDEALCVGTDYALIPLVRDAETTHKFYPEHRTAWREASDCQRGEPSDHVSPVGFKLLRFLSSGQPGGEWQQPPLPASTPCEELEEAA